MTLQWICLIGFLLYFSVEIVYNLIFYQKIIDALRDGRLTRAQLYVRLVAGLWIPALLLLLPVFFGSWPLNDLGIGIRSFSRPTWLLYASGALALVYFGYQLYTFTFLRSARKRGEASEVRIPEKMRLMLPVSQKEKGLWLVTSALVGAGEEFLFRGFLFYIFTALFPSMPLIAVLAISTAIFGAGHLYQGPKEALKPVFIGLFFGIFYISFGTIWPCVILHSLQDACAAYAI